ncbi:hypothetical protein C7W93_03795 [Glaciimonas sp. PCH181]|nr:hypothetical protein C7W93_03795 [Glaciimonas sp. PCH181]
MLTVFIIPASKAAGNTASNIAAGKPISTCSMQASPECFFRVDLKSASNNGGTLGFYASEPFTNGNTRLNTSITSVLIAIHGHSHDVSKTFNAAIAAAKTDNLRSTLIIAPLFQVDDANAQKCRTLDQQSSQPGDLMWNCNSWMADGAAQNMAEMTSFKALDQLVEQIAERYPSVKTVTIAGFSAGAQMVQHYVPFSNLNAKPYALRFVIADPGTWLYFDQQRPQPTIADKPVSWADCDLDGKTDFGKCSIEMSTSQDMENNCAGYNDWKYGTDKLPKMLSQNRSAGLARKAYQAADITYLEAALDSGSSKKASYKILDKSCGAALQGPFRLHRGLAYHLYDQQILASPHHRMMEIVPDCGHNVACVFPSEIGRKALFR